MYDNYNVGWVIVSPKINEKNAIQFTLFKTILWIVMGLLKGFNSALDREVFIVLTSIFL